MPQLPPCQHPRRLTLQALVGLALLLLTGASHALPGAGEGWPALRDGAIVLLRHAEAPGIGDPPQFDLRDCRTQRNLNAAGRAQAQRIGEQFRLRGVAVGAVLQSQWCRTRDTAALAFPGRPRDDADFNSFFDDGSRETKQTAAARQTLSRWRGPGVLVVVTHQVNITALTGVAPAAGEGVVVVPQGDGVTVLRRLQLDR